MDYTYDWSPLPEYISEFNSSIHDISLEINQLQKSINRKKAIMEAMIAASHAEEAMAAAE